MSHYLQVRHKLPLMKVILGALIASWLAACGGETTPTTQTPSPTSQATTTPATPIPTPVSHFPPTTFADLQALAALGSASSVQEIQRSVGLGTCPRPERDVVVASYITGETLAEDLLAYWFAQQLNTSSCGSSVLAHTGLGEVGEVPSAGSLDLTVTGASYSLEIDLGSALLGNLRVYRVTY